MPPADNERGDVDFSQYNYCCDERCWYVTDCPGMFCSLLTWMLIIYAEFVVLVVILYPHKNLIYQICNGIGYNVISLLAIFSYIRAVFSDPGAVPVDNELRNYRGGPPIRCRKCGCMKPPRAHHCSVCHRCIRKMDHHCPWINNCVGEDNRKYFVLFNFYIALMCIYTGTLASVKFLECFTNDWAHTTPFNGSITMLLLSIVAFESFVFGVFTVIIGIIQLNDLIHDRTYIDKIKHEDDESDSQTRCENYQSVFGESCCSWFCPCASSSNNSYV